jgi:hypothetical protein
MDQKLIPSRRIRVLCGSSEAVRTMKPGRPDHQRNKDELHTNKINQFRRAFRDGAESSDSKRRGLLRVFLQIKHKKR